MTKRNKNRRIFTNNEDLYKERTGRKNALRQYRTGKYHYPDEETISRITVAEEYWKVGDRLYKYAKKYYNDERYWWLIAWFNRKPTEHHFNIGEKIKIITNLSDARRLFFGE